MVDIRQSPSGAVVGSVPLGVPQNYNFPTAEQTISSGSTDETILQSEGDPINLLPSEEINVMVTVAVNSATQVTGGTGEIRLVRRFTDTSSGTTDVEVATFTSPDLQPEGSVNALDNFTATEEGGVTYFATSSAVGQDIVLAAGGCSMSVVAY